MIRFTLMLFILCASYADAKKQEKNLYIDAGRKLSFNESQYQKPTSTPTKKQNILEEITPNEVLEQNETATQETIEQNETAIEESFEQNNTKQEELEADLYGDFENNETNITVKVDLSSDTLFHAQREDGTTFGEAIERSIENSYKIEAAFEQVLQGKLKKREAFAGHLPVINFTGDGGYESRKVKKDDYNPGNMSSLTTEQKYRKIDLYLTITENLWSGGSIEDAINKEEANLKATLYDYKEKLENLVVDTAKAYFEVVYSEIALKVAKKNMKSYLKILDIVQTKEKNGAATKGDVNFIQANVQNAKIDLVQREKAVQDSHANYTYLLQINSDEELPFEIEIPLYLNDLNSSLADAQANNAKLLKQKFYIDSTRYDFLSTKGSFHPKIDFAINGESRNEFNIGLGKREKANAILLFNYNLYRGGKDQARAVRLLSKMREQKYLLHDIKRKLQYDVKVLNQSVQSLRDSLKLKEKEVVASREVVKSYWIAFGHGTQDLQALQLAQINLNRSEQAYTKYKKDLIISNIELMKKTGVLLDFLKISFKNNLNEFNDSSNILYQYYDLEH